MTSSMWAFTNGRISLGLVIKPRSQWLEGMTYMVLICASAVRGKKHAPKISNNKHLAETDIRLNERSQSTRPPYTCVTRRWREAECSYGQLFSDSTADSSFRRWGTSPLQYVLFSMPWLYHHGQEFSSWPQANDDAMSCCLLRMPERIHTHRDFVLNGHC